ncbi:unnamed protein product [Phytophthora fragariaefolia]|uniref:Unnamed protein product n=1 Tax=Phytophthora fragariaefolia TaxID=1490495 RepID=A0A9W6Y3H3_9STRA|nr:unnamed protein product [Phytophthora fragariaefolia]
MRSMPNHLTLQANDVPVGLTDSIPLLELLEDSGAMESHQTPGPSAPAAATATPTVGIHALETRLQERIAGGAGVEEPLKSHSFRRGDVQHENASSELTAQWIFDRGAWNLTTTNIAFANVFNTPKEDHQVAKSLSGMAPKQACVLSSLDVFDSATQEHIRDVSHKFFNASHALGNRPFNICGAVRDVLTVTIILHYPSLMKMNAEHHHERALVQEPALHLVVILGD